MREPFCDTAVLIPCYNEGATIGAVVSDFRRRLPGAAIYVFDNGSTDNSVLQARVAGAIVYCEPRRGKGNVVGAMFRRIDAAFYVMVDGDGTYPAERVRDLLSPVREGWADMVVGSRLHPDSQSRFKTLNLLGNKLFLTVVNLIYGARITDLLSGYRAFNARVAKGLPVLSRGFDIESELTLKCLQRRLNVYEVPVDLASRPDGSFSKIRIMRDGMLILSTVLSFVRDYKPLTAFGSVGLVLAVLGLLPGAEVVREYLATGFITHLPSAVLAVGLELSGVIAGFTGIVLHAISRRFQEIDCQLQRIAEMQRLRNWPLDRSETTLE